MPCLDTATHWLLQVCERQLVRALPAETGTDWSSWLLLADQLQARQLLAVAVPHVVRRLLRSPPYSPPTAAFQGLGPLSRQGWQLVAESLLVEALHHGVAPPPACTPLAVTWAAPGDLLQVLAAAQPDDG